MGKYQEAADTHKSGADYKVSPSEYMKNEMDRAKNKNWTSLMKKLKS
jgi:hypothetical protein